MRTEKQLSFVFFVFFLFEEMTLFLVKFKSISEVLNFYKKLFKKLKFVTI